MFTARRLDILANSSLKIYHYRARAYDPQTGRFLQTDPIGYHDSMNLYEYVTGNPTNWVGPWGLKSLYEDQFSMWDRWRYEVGSVGGVFGLSTEQAARMDKYWQQYQRANALNQHPKEVAEYCEAAKQIASGCAKSAAVDTCRFIVFVDENGCGAVYDRITDYVAEPFTNRILMCYEYGSGDLDQAYKDACNWQMIGADLVGLTDLCYGVDYLQGQDSIDINTGSAFRGEEQYVKGLQGLIKFCGTVAVASKVTMACGEAAAGTGAASTKGIYEFPDSAGGGKPYVGQSGNIPQRLKQHRASGRLGEGVPAKTSPVDGGKLAREIAEHRRIQKITGGVPAAKSPRVSNKRNPIGPKRGHLIKE